VGCAPGEQEWDGTVDALWVHLCILVSAAFFVLALLALFSNRFIAFVRDRVAKMLQEDPRFPHFLEDAIDPVDDA
jgi:hypothetical protein